MKYLIIARFDDDTDAALCRMKENAASKQSELFSDSSDWPPHITLAAYEDVDIRALRSHVSKITERFPVTDITLDSLGVFNHGAEHDTDVIYLAPSPTPAFCGLYWSFHSKLDDFCGNYGRAYTAEGAIPFHSTLTVCPKDDFSRIFDTLRDGFTPISAQIRSIEIYENPKKPIAVYRLRGAKQKRIQIYA
ncbi:MAG: 2'-5' RNA ligase family protein [Eubacteriales bacterium]